MFLLSLSSSVVSTPLLRRFLPKVDETWFVNGKCRLIAPKITHLSREKCLGPPEGGPNARRAEWGAPMCDFTTDFTDRQAVPASFFVQAILFKDTSLVRSLQMDPSTPFPGPTTASGFQHYVHTLILDCFIHPCGNVGCPPDQSAVWRLTIPDIGLSGIS